MMNSKVPTEAFIWIWLPHATKPVIAGKLTASGKHYLFNYGKSYLARPDAIAIYDKELPLRPGIIYPLNRLEIPGCIRDAAPDAWGKRVIISRLLGLSGANLETVQLDELTYLLESGSDRIGALDFQRSPTVYEPRALVSASLEELLESATRVEQGLPLTAELDQALFHGSSIGGARPKALIKNKNTYLIAKFSSTTDLYSVVKAEFIAMKLAKLAGLNVAKVSLTKAANKDVLLIERFDRIETAQGCERRLLVSALTLFGMDEMMARYASYQHFAELIRRQFYDPLPALQELFARICFNILVGNTDDHARNHAAFWDGQMLTLSPAYDICPQNRTGYEATQAMLITENNRASTLATCLQGAKHFLLSKEQAKHIIETQVYTIVNHWETVCDEASLNEIDRKFLLGRQIVNPYCIVGLDEINKTLYQFVKKAMGTLGAHS